MLNWDPRARELLLRNASLLLRNASFLLHAPFHLSKHTVHGHHCFIYRYAPFHLLISTHHFNAKAETINALPLSHTVHGSKCWGKWCTRRSYQNRAYQRYAVHSQGFCFFSQLPVAECFQSPSMLRPIPLHCRSPTQQPERYQNRAQQLMKANPVGRTKRKDPLCSTNARAHLLSAWVIVAATPHLCIHR